MSQSGRARYYSDWSKEYMSESFVLEEVRVCGDDDYNDDDDDERDES